VALNIKDPVADRLVRELAAATGESITTTVTTAVRERLERVRGAAPSAEREAELTRIALEAASRPDRDPRTPEDILGYGSDGLSA
jgi:antitoxin VapB